MKEDIYSTRQRATDLLNETLSIWQKGDHIDQLEGLAKDPVFSLLMTALAYRANEMDGEVERLRQMVKQADIDALVAVAEMYDLTPEELTQMMISIRGDRSQPEADIPDAITAIPAEPEQIMFPEEEDSLDDEET